MGGMWVFRVPLAETVVGPAGRIFGLPGLALDIDRLDLHEMRARNFRVGAQRPDGLAPISATGMAATYTLAGLLDGRVEALVLDGLVVHANFSDEGLTVPGLDFGAPSSGPARSMPELPAMDLTLDILSFEIAMSRGPVVASGSVVWRPTDPAGGELTADLVIDYDDGPPASATADIEFSASGPGPTTHGQVVLHTVRLGEWEIDEGRVAFDLGDRAAAVDAVATGDFGSVTLALAGPAAGGFAELGDGWSGRLIADGVSFDLGGYRALGLGGEIHGAVARSDGELAVTLGPGSMVRAGTFAIEGVGTLSLNDALTFAEDQDQTIGYRLETGLAVRLATGKLDLGFSRPGEGLRYELRSPALTLQLEGGRGQAVLTDADIDAVGLRLAARGVDAEIGWEEAARITGRIRVTRIEHVFMQQGARAYFAPLGADILLRTDEVGLLLVNARLADSGGDLNIDLAVRHNWLTGAGDATASIERITLAPGPFRLEQIFPVLHGMVSEAEGTIDLSAQARWLGSDLQTGARLQVELDRVATSEWSAEALSGAIDFDSLFPLTTPPDQEIRIGRLDIGLPVTNGRVRAQLKRDGVIEGRITGLDIFGGRIESDRFVFDPGSGDFSVVLHATGLRLDEVLASAEFGSLTSTGELSGDIPLRVTNGEVAISGGELRATSGGGVIVYTPGQGGAQVGAANDAMALVLEALENFHYDDVVMRVDEGAAEEMELRFSLSGRNPDLYDGKPLVLNITLSGPLQEILNRGRETLTLPTDILERTEVLDGAAP